MSARPGGASAGAAVECSQPVTATKLIQRQGPSGDSIFGNSVVPVAYVGFVLAADVFAFLQHFNLTFCIFHNMRLDFSGLVVQFRSGWGVSFDFFRYSRGISAADHHRTAELPECGVFFSCRDGSHSGCYQFSAGAIAFATQCLKRRFVMICRLRHFACMFLLYLVACFCSVLIQRLPKQGLLTHRWMVTMVYLLQAATSENIINKKAGQSKHG